MVPYLDEINQGEGGDWIKTERSFPFTDITQVDAAYMFDGGGFSVETRRLAYQAVLDRVPSGRGKLRRQLRERLKALAAESED
jgi:hypothetical protein